MSQMKKYKHSKKTKQYLSKLRSQQIANGIHGGFNDIKWYHIKNIKGIQCCVRGNWQLWTAQYLNANNINWQRNKFLSYIKNDQIVRTYNPDFYLPDLNLYIEVKGYFSQKDKEKMQFVLTQNDIKILWIDTSNINKIKNNTILFEQIPIYNKLADILFNKEYQNKLIKEKRKICLYSNCACCSKLIKINNRRKDCDHYFCSMQCLIKYSKQHSNCPSKEQLLNDLQQTDLQKIGLKYNVSSNAVRKWCKNYDIDFKKFIYNRHKCIIFNNKKYTLHELSQILHLSQTTILNRLKANIPLDKPIFKPIKYELNGKEYTISEISELYNIPKTTLRRKLKNGLSLKQIIEN